MADEFDLYEFPKDHIGRKTYVHVRGHSRSVPYIHTYKGYDGCNWVLPEYGGSDEGFAHGATSAFVMSDMTPYQSPLEAGVTVSSRSQHRDMMRKHGVIEVGTERMGNFSKSVGEMAPRTRAGYDIKAALEGRMQR